MYPIWTDIEFNYAAGKEGAPAVRLEAEQRH